MTNYNDDVLSPESLGSQVQYDPEGYPVCEDLPEDMVIHHSDGGEAYDTL